MSTPPDSPPEGWGHTWRGGYSCTCRPNEPCAIHSLERGIAPVRHEGYEQARMEGYAEGFKAGHLAGRNLAEQEAEAPDD